MKLLLGKLGRGSTLVGLALLTAACGGDEKKVEAPIVQESAADEILRIGAKWTSTMPDQGLLSPPSPISMFRTQRTSRVELTRSSAHEELTIEEELELRDGSRVRCRTVLSHGLRVRYGRRNGEAGVELVRPPLNAVRTCDGAHPEPQLSEVAYRSLLVLRSDQLVAVEPARDKRSYLPDAY